MKVLIFGCGPSGLIAAHTAKTVYNADVHIISVKRPSRLYGCQYLHEPIPEITPEENWRHVDYRLIGSEDEYRKKVYGTLRPPVSPQQLLGQHRSWDIRYAYDVLYDTYENRITDHWITPEDVSGILGHFKPDVAFSSVPAPILCQVGEMHSFSSVSCWAIGDAPERNQRVTDLMHIDSFTVTCNGDPDIGWYRASNVWGYATIEWPHARKPPIAGVVEFKKPLVTNCDCLPDVVRIGRYGKWQKGVYAHRARWETINVLEQKVHPV